MAEEQPAASSSAQEDGPLAVNLQIVSPSVGVGNLRFPGLPATTTVRQLKDRIRETLPSRPADDHQRLIHRGRLLARDTDTLQDVFGEETIRSGDQQTIHLVVRDTGEALPPSDPQPRPPPEIRHHFQHHVLRNMSNAAMARPGSAPIAASHTAHAPVAHTDHHLQFALLQQHFRQLAQHPPTHQNPPGHHATQDGADRASANAADPTGGTSSPARQAFQTIARESIGPDGQRYSVRITVNDTMTVHGAPPQPPAAEPFDHRPLSAVEVHNILHGADATRAAQAMANAMERNASGPPPAAVAGFGGSAMFNVPVRPIPPGVTTPIFPGVSRNASRAATPDLSTRPTSQGSGTIPNNLHSQTQRQPSQGRPEVYILHSPTGPRGLLINGPSEMYTTPASRAQYTQQWMSIPARISVPGHPAQALENLAHQGHPMAIFGQAAATQMDHPQQQIYQPPTPHGQQQQQQQQQQPLPQAAPEQQPAIRRRPVGAPAVRAAHAQPPAPAPQLNHPGNPGAGALVAAIWPHIWLIIRLVAFAWWFSYSDPSWERWLSLGLAALVVLAINTGIFNAMVNNAFNPVREQLEGMIPFENPDGQRETQRQAQRQQNQAAAVGGNGMGGVEPDPAQVAARLVAQRRIQNGNWLWDQFRRIERAGILFLASFAPGVAERHIHLLEERERAERRAAEEARRRAEEEVARLQAEAEAQAQAQTQGEEAVDEQEGQEVGGQEGQNGAAEEQQQESVPGVERPQPPPVEA
ncbi:hypothetical protein VTI74DRAFT_5252 [Chaetomium olivicolor]